jgi:hypothetical protein
VIVGVGYFCRLTTVPLELNNPGNATTGSKVQLISANFKLARTQKDLNYKVGDNTVILKEPSTALITVTCSLANLPTPVITIPVTLLPRVYVSDLYPVISRVMFYSLM